MTRTRLCTTGAILAMGAALAAGTAAISAAAPISAAVAAAKSKAVSPSAVVIRPEAVHIGHVFSGPVSTAVCKNKIHIAC